MEQTPNGFLDLKQEKTLKDFLVNYKETLAILLSIASSIWLFLTNLKESSNFKEFSANVNSFLSFVEILNVLILLVAIFMLTRKYVLVKKEKDDKKNYLENLVTLEEGYVENSDKIHKFKENVEWKIERTNKLVSQLVLALQGFTVVLLFMYSLLSLTDLRPAKLNEADKKYLKRVNFLNDSSEVEEPNSEYNQIIAANSNGRIKAFKAKNLDSSIVNKKSNDLFLKQFTELKFDTLKTSKRSTNDTNKKSLSPNQSSNILVLKNINKYDSIKKSYLDAQKKKLILKSLDSIWDKKLIDTFAKARGELAIIKKRNATLERYNNLIETIYGNNKPDRFAMR